jgi:hypothetical protein
MIISENLSIGRKNDRLHIGLNPAGAQLKKCFKKLPRTLNYDPRRVPQRQTHSVVLGKFKPLA